MIRRPASVALVLAVAVSLAVPLIAQSRTVTRVGIVARPKVYRGPCPATIEFIATVFVSHHPVMIEYEWERSDGARSSRQRTEIRSAGQGISTTWTLGAGRERREVWERLHVLAPTGIRSPVARMRIVCQ
jgi:hypothetical protein